MTEHQGRSFSFGRRHIPVFIGILLLAAAGVFLIVRQVTRGPSVPIPVATDDPGVVGGAVSEWQQVEGSMLSIRLSEGQALLQAIEQRPVATGEPLSPEEIEQILARLPDLTPEPGDQTEFQLAQDPIPPPRPGETITQTFPQPEPSPAPDVSEDGPLTVLRYAPEGEVPIAPLISVTFNQPMVPLGTLSDLAKKDVPVKIEPDLPGTWRWLGTKTLTFDYDSELVDRMPMATEYRVTVPAGTKSETGGVLAEGVTWTFATPPPKMLATAPGGDSVSLEPIFFVAFDQRIDPAAVLKTIQVRAGNNEVAVKMARDAEIEQDERVSRLVKDATEGRWLAFKTKSPLPADTGISVTIGPGTPSAEGPLVTQEQQSFSFSTYAPLRIEEHGCSWYDDVCRPLTPFYIRFNNPLDLEAYQESMVRVTPEIPGAVINVHGNSIEIRGATQGQTTYQVMVDGNIQDTFGQKLGKDTTLTFKVDKAEPYLAGPDQSFITIDPSAPKPIFSVYAINYAKVNVKVYTVQPSDWPGYLQYLSDWQRTDNPPSLPGQLVYDKSVNIQAPADKLTQVDIDLKPYLNGDFGHLIVVVEPPKGLLETEEQKWQRFSQTVHAWTQITQIGLDAFADYETMTAWTTALKDGSPLSGVSIQPRPQGASATTGDDGIARFAFPSGASYLVASKGADTALLPSSTHYWRDYGWNTSPPSDEMRWYVFDDRQIYKPGEEMHVKGWLRRVGGRQDGDVGLVGDGVTAVSYQVTDPQGNEIGSGQAEVNALGGFDFVFTVPEAVNLGYAQINFEAYGSYSLDGGSYGHPFQIQEFRRPEFEVTARNETMGPYFAGDHAVVAVDAAYYAGGPLQNADVTWQVTSSPGSYAPPNWPDFTFGTWQPWWWFDWEYGPDDGSGTAETFTGKTDAGGTHYLRIDFDANDDGEPRPVSVMAESSVMDVNRQAWSSTTSLLVHPSDRYVGLRSDRAFVERGTPLEVDVIVTDLDGNAEAGRPVEVRAARMAWKFRDGSWQQEETDIQQCNQKSALEPITCSFETKVGGTYQITAMVKDDQGRQNQSRLTRWVSGGELPPSRKVEQEEVTLIPDKETYQPGDTAQILVQSPFSPAEGLLTVTRSGILYTQRFRIDQGSTTLQIPIEDKHIPNLNIQVDLTGSAPRTDDQGKELKDVAPRPAYATGQLNLSIPPLARTLALQVAPDASELEPGGATSLSVVLKDAAGQPVPDAELAVVVVDEAVLALSDYQLPDPVSIFYTDRSSYLNSIYSRAGIVLVDPQVLARQDASAVAALPTATGAGGWAFDPQTEAPAEEAMAVDMFRGDVENKSSGPTSEPIRMRSDFNPLALFAPSARTDANGQARVSIQLPDNLTRYRVMVVAVDTGGQRFGTGESNMTARLPLMVRPSAPRFLNFGDRFELPVVLQNQTDDPMNVDVAIRGSNLDLTGGTGLRVTVPARDRVEVHFPSAAEQAGTARVQIAAISGSYADAATVELPVYTPATTEAFATYGVLDAGVVAQSVLSPSGVFPQYGGLEINTSSTALQALTDAVLYLTSYPFECSEQLASRILGVAALRDVLTAFKADGLPAPQEMEAAVDRDIARLQGLQNPDGGFPYWRRGFESSPFNTIHVAHALARAQQKGFNVPEQMHQSSLEYLRNIENYYPSWYGQQTRRTLSAYALYVRSLTGDRDSAKASNLLNEAGLENLPVETVGWLWPVIDDTAQLEAIRVFVNNHVVETAGAANFTTAYDDETYLLLSSDRRTDAILLDALINDNPQSDLVPKVVAGLLAHRTKGRWGNTQENVFVLLALDRYFNTYEAETPDFVARLWLGETYAGEFAFEGRTTERQEVMIPMSYVISETEAGGGTENLILSKDGPGRLYYRLGLRYAPTDLNLDPLDMGFVVQRRYEAVDNPDDVSQDSQGIWHIKAGARVRIKITMVATNRRYHVALVDPLPAGLEIVNPALAVSGSTPQDPNSPDTRYGWWWWGTWYEHQNLRDERAEAFTSLLWDGVYTYTYIARATTPGTFVVPPAKAEEMYSPEVFGRSSSDWVVVE
ncbi:MAG: hypothetical protein JXB07_16815 [Anaerolineae bacterium]|nr:hypothetical protein [Anaerolineae bacterium]